MAERSDDTAFACPRNGATIGRDIRTSTKLPSCAHHFETAVAARVTASVAAVQNLASILEATGFQLTFGLATDSFLPVYDAKVRFH